METITEAQARQQIVRLTVLRFKPEDISELVAIYREYARNFQHSVRMTDWLLRRYTDFPVPLEVMEAAEATISSEDVVKPDRRCRQCDGTGYEQVWQLVTYNKTPGGGCFKSIDNIFSREAAEDLRRLCDGKTQILYDCTRPCTTCRYGAAIAAPRDPGPAAAKKRKALQPVGVDARKFAAGDADD